MPTLLHSSCCGKTILRPWVSPAHLLLECMGHLYIQQPGPISNACTAFFMLEPIHSWALGHAHIFFWVRSSSYQIISIISSDPGHTSGTGARGGFNQWCKCTQHLHPGHWVTSQSFNAIKAKKHASQCKHKCSCHHRRISKQIYFFLSFLFFHFSFFFFFCFLLLLLLPSFFLLLPLLLLLGAKVWGLGLRGYGLRPNWERYFAQLGALLCTLVCYIVCNFLPKPKSAPKNEKCSQKRKVPPSELLVDNR